MIDRLQTFATMLHVGAGLSYKHLKFPTVSLRDTVLITLIKLEIEHNF